MKEKADESSQIRGDQGHMATKLNVRSWLDPGTKKGHLWKIGEMWRKSLVYSTVPVLISYLW